MLIKLYFIFFKIGLIAYGGGYTIISLLYHDFVDLYNWISKEDFFNLISIAQITPGPIAINSATFIGYKLSGFLGSLISTIGVITPSIILVILLIIVLKKVNLNDSIFLNIILKTVVVLIIITALNLFNNIFELKKIRDLIFSFIFENNKYYKDSFINENFIMKYFFTIFIFITNLLILNFKKIKIKIYYLMFLSGLFFIIISYLSYQF
ncbi:MAG: chromate transporter [Spirochaetes bacterium]|nr:chromate transporter [Spirochaetota bacterium]